VIKKSKHSKVKSSKDPTFTKHKHGKQESAGQKRVKYEDRYAVDSRTPYFAIVAVASMGFVFAVGLASFRRIRSSKHQTNNGFDYDALTPEERQHIAGEDGVSGFSVMSWNQRSSAPWSPSQIEGKAVLLGRASHADRFRVEPATAPVSPRRSPRRHQTSTHESNDP
jgi:hypothetical protein